MLIVSRNEVVLSGLCTSKSLVQVVYNFGWVGGGLYGYFPDFLIINPYHWHTLKSGYIDVMVRVGNAVPGIIGNHGNHIMFYFKDKVSLTQVLFND